MDQEIPIRCITWNVHRAKGTDGRRDAARVEAYLGADIAAEKPDILALQEADEECRPHAGIFDVAKIAETTGLRYVHDTPDLRWGPESDGFLGTILFLSPRFSRLHTDVIDLPGHCHRGAIAVETRISDRHLRVMSLHLSLSQPLRMVQMRIIGQYLRRRPAMPTVLLGDFNEWRPWGGLMFHHRLVGSRFSGPAKASFPSKWPIFPLDRILADRGAKISGLRVLTSPMARIASDHLPICADVTFL